MSKITLCPPVPDGYLPQQQNNVLFLVRWLDGWKLKVLFTSGKSNCLTLQYYLDLYNSLSPQAQFWNLKPILGICLLRQNMSDLALRKRSNVSAICIRIKIKAKQLRCLKSSCLYKFLHDNFSEIAQFPFHLASSFSVQAENSSGLKAKASLASLQFEEWNKLKSILLAKLNLFQVYPIILAK